MRLSLFIVFALCFLHNCYAQQSTVTDDRDGQTYQTITIGQYTWMQENLRFIHSSSAYQKSNKKLKKFGNFYRKDGIQNVCPDGWHIPLYSEWKNTIENVLNEKNILVNDIEIDTINLHEKNEYYDSFVFRNKSKKLNLYKSPLFLNPFGWIENGKRIKSLKTANLWIIDDAKELVNLHIHLSAHQFHAHSHKHHITDTDKKIRYLSVRCVKSNL